MNSSLARLGAKEVIAPLGLAPHPEGGHYRESFRDPAEPEGRGHATAISYLLDAGETSEWRRVDAAEIWRYCAGAPLVISVSPNGHDASAHHLGSDLKAGQRPQFVAPAGWWQSAISLGAWTLVGCTVSPGFSFAGFEMAAPGWRPTPRKAGCS